MSSSGPASSGFGEVLGTNESWGFLANFSVHHSMFRSNLSTLTRLGRGWDLLKVVIFKDVKSVLLAYDLDLGLGSSKEFLW